MKRINNIWKDVVNSRIGWASYCDSNNFVRNNINPYINITTTRKVIANVDKVREQ